MLGNVDIKVRPLKLAFLVEPNSTKQIRQAIQISSTLWGGSYCPIIPLYKTSSPTWADKPLKAPSAKDVVLGYIDSFDPDILVQLSKDIPQYVKDTGLRVITPNEIWDKHSPYDNIFNPDFGIGIFDLFNNIFEEYFKYKSKYSVKVVIPKIPKKDGLLWASIFGEFPQKTLELLRKYYSEPLEIKEPNINFDTVSELFKGDTIFPRRATQSNLNSFRRRSFRGDAIVFYFDSSKPTDIIDYWNLRALGREVFPLPKQLQDNTEYVRWLKNFLRSHRKNRKHQPEYCEMASFVKGRNSTTEEMQKFAQTLDLKPDPSDKSQDGFFVLQHWYPRIWDLVARNYDSAEPADTYEETTSIEISDENSLKVHFKPIFPKFAKDIRIGGEPRCANEISFRFYGLSDHFAEVLPKSTGKKFVRAISSSVSFRNEWRSGRNGLVHLAKDTMTEYWAVPTSENVFFAWLEDQGWKPELSNPGILAKQIHKKLDGFVQFLGNEKLIKVLDHMNGGQSLDHDQPTKLELEEGRDLSVDKLKGKLEDKKAQNKNHLHDFLLSKGVFKLGLKTQCPNCFRKSWYSLDDVKDTCTCPRCLNNFLAVGNLHSSSWSYKTVGSFSVPQHADGAFSVLLGVHFFNEHHSSGIKLSPVFSFNAKDKAGKDLEADFAGFWQQTSARGDDSGVLFAECKTYSDFEKKDFDRMTSLAKTFPGSVIVFCTLKDQLSDFEIKNITRIAKAGRKLWAKHNRPINPVLILTAKELTSFHGIPYCWDEALKEKFDHVHGMIPICDATQQVYLKLPSWEVEEHERWEKIHKRRMTKKGAKK